MWDGPRNCRFSGFLMEKNWNFWDLGPAVLIQVIDYF